MLKAACGRRVAAVSHRGEPGVHQFDEFGRGACDGRGAVLLNPLASPCELQHQLDDANVGLSEIHNIGPGKGFVSSPTTLKKYKTGYYVSSIFPRWSMEKWLADGQPHVQTRLKEYGVEFLKDFQFSNLPDNS